MSAEHSRYIAQAPQCAPAGRQVGLAGRGAGARVPCDMRYMLDKIIILSMKQTRTL
jgi:hypothetical protein